MRATGGVEGDVAGESEIGRADRTADAAGGALPEARKDRAFHGAEVVASSIIGGCDAVAGNTGEG